MKGKKFNSVVELPTFLANVDSILQNADEKEGLIEYVAKYPEKGDEIPRTGGLRKLRWVAKGKGKRGGARIIYYFYNDYSPVFLLSIYSKGKQEKLKPGEEKKLEKLAALLKEECKMKGC
jgi:mRNA-degrading endonuclease RelE of RelBE toxin-antitoxin system